MPLPSNHLQDNFEGFHEYAFCCQNGCRCTIAALVVTLHARNIAEGASAQLIYSVGDLLNFRKEAIVERHPFPLLPSTDILKHIALSARNSKRDIITYRVCPTHETLGATFSFIVRSLEFGLGILSCYSRNMALTSAVSPRYSPRATSR